MKEGIDFFIKENSWVARIAAAKLHAPSIAIVIGKTIHLHNARKNELLSNKRWLKHELCHVRQFKKHGNIRFILKYVWESVKKGYTNNKYEVEAREAESSG